MLVVGTPEVRPPGVLTVVGEPNRLPVVGGAPEPGAFVVGGTVALEPAVVGVAPRLVVAVVARLVVAVVARLVVAVVARLVVAVAPAVVGVALLVVPVVAAVVDVVACVVVVVASVVVVGACVVVVVASVVVVGACVVVVAGAASWNCCPQGVFWTMLGVTSPAAKLACSVDVRLGSPGIC